MPAHSEITLDATVVVAEEQVSCDLAGEAVVLNIRDGVYYGMDPIAARIWMLVQTPRSVLEIREDLLKEFDVDEARCTRELLAFLDQLSGWGLVELQEHRASPGNHGI
jgi:coenzyme PQQ synthesis protein D (PqqD)